LSPHFSPNRCCNAFGNSATPVSQFLAKLPHSDRAVATRLAIDNSNRLATAGDGTWSARYSNLANSALAGTVTFKQSSTTRMTTRREYDLLIRRRHAESLSTANWLGLATEGSVLTVNGRTKGVCRRGENFRRAVTNIGNIFIPPTCEPHTPIRQMGFTARMHLTDELLVAAKREDQIQPGYPNPKVKNTDFSRITGLNERAQRYAPQYVAPPSTVSIIDTVLSRVPGSDAAWHGAEDASLAVSMAAASVASCGAALGAVPAASVIRTVIIAIP